MMRELPMPDLSAGICLPGRSDIPAEAWLGTTDPELTRRAVQACRECPVLHPCASWALTLPVLRFDLAVIGGMTGPERNRAIRARAERRRAAS